MPSGRPFLFTFDGMEQMYAYYGEVVAENEDKIRRFNRRMNGMGGARLLLVAGWIVTLVLAGDLRAVGVVGITLAFVLPFTALMILHDRLLNKKRYAAAWQELCRNELKGLDYDFSAFDGAPEKTDAAHSFSLDLDLFGEESLFQSVNRTVTHGGRERLAQWFQSPSRDKKIILNRQDAIRELANLTALRQHFQVTGSLHRGEKNDSKVLQALTAHSFPFARKIGWKALTWIVPALWVGLAAAYFIGVVSLAVLIVFFVVSTFLAYAKNKEVSALHQAFDKVEKRLSVYSRLIFMIEGSRFDSQMLEDIRARLRSEEKQMPASRVVKKLSRHLNALDQRGNMVVAILNIFILRDIRIAVRLEKWKQDHQGDIGRWFDGLADFDALCSMGTFACNHPDYPYPSLADDYFTLEGKALGHPLMRREVCVRNDVSFSKAPSFMIVTGANMAGKSTYLRTVAVNFILACTGMPVCAEELTVYPAALVTSLRTSDSLARNESYFFAELKRLKMIIDRLKSGEQLFVVLDEILKGTNSADKQKGSMALVRQFISCGTCGIIATHDLVLGTLADEFPGFVHNYRFEGEITGDRLDFSYRLREGIARNMNATFLMEKMGITV